MFKDLDSVSNYSALSLKIDDPNNQFLPTFCAVQKFIADKNNQYHDNLDNMDKNKLRNLLNLDQEISQWANQDKNSSN
jgi:hypothetical protein